MALASIGTVSTAYAFAKKEPPELYLPLAFFTSMEVLQAFTYTVIDQCALPSNQIATLLGYLHITFQPFFINYMGMYFIPKRIREVVQVPVFALCFIAAILMIIRVYPFPWSPLCEMGTLLCGTNLCSVHGSWHIAWNIPFNNIFGNFPIYAIVGIVLPFLYGSWRAALYNLLAGPVLASFLSSNPNEQPAIWRLLSIGLLLLVIKSPLRSLLHVKKWFWWTLVPERPALATAAKTEA